jgi:hypothetical protein
VGLMHHVQNRSFRFCDPPNSVIADFHSHVSGFNIQTKVKERIAMVVKTLAREIEELEEVVTRCLSLGLVKPAIEASRKITKLAVFLDRYETTSARGRR